MATEISFSSILVDFGGATPEQTSKSASASNFAPDRLLLTSVRPKITKICFSRPNGPSSSTDHRYNGPRSMLLKRTTNGASKYFSHEILFAFRIFRPLQRRPPRQQPKKNFGQKIRTKKIRTKKIWTKKFGRKKMGGKARGQGTAAAEARHG